MTDSLPPPPQSADSNDKLFIILCHVSVFLGVALLLPLIVYLVKKQESPLVSDHAKEALNFHITAAIAGVISCFLIPLFGLGLLLLFIIGIGVAILAILAAIKASDGKFYKYPLTLRLVS